MDPTNVRHFLPLENHRRGHLPTVPDTDFNLTLSCNRYLTLIITLTTTAVDFNHNTNSVFKNTTQTKTNNPEH